MGDLNYRIDNSSFEKVEEMIKKNQYFDLLLLDQLLNEKEK